MKISLSVVAAFILFPTVACSAGWTTVWQLGAPGRGWIVDGVGGGPEVDFIQEIDVNDPPGSPSNMGIHSLFRDVDDDYYFAGTYPDPPLGVGHVATDEIAMERAFAGTDNNLRIHFNMPTTLNLDDRLRFSFEANNLDERESNSDPRYGVEISVNGNVVMPELIIRPSELDTIISAEFTVADAGLVGGPGIDNVLLLTGNTNNGANYGAEGGGQWMGMDYHHLEILPVPEPSGLTTMLCGLCWAIPFVLKLSSG